MAKTIPQDYMVNFALGAAQAVLAREAVVRAPGVKNECLFRALLFHGFVMLPVGMIFFGNFSDWSVFYAWDATNDPRLGWVLVFGYLPVGLAGNALAQVALRKGQQALAIALVAAPLAILGAITAWAGSRFLLIGTLAEFEAGTAVHLWESKAALLAFGLTTPLVAGGFALVAYLNWRDSQRQAA